MALELLFTSATQGLKPGSQGYCTVQCTQAMPGPLAERLEALSAYRPVYPSQSEQAKLNPVNVAYWRIRLMGKTFPVLSRIADYGLDYSNRTNKIAHHLVIDSSELNEAGPAAIASSGTALLTEWNQKVESIAQPRRLPAVSSKTGVCRHWQKVMGDAGWAGVVAEEILKDQKQPIFLIFEPGQEMLPLIVEVQSLLPANLRWKSTFSTYLTYLPPEAECQIRCLLKGSKEAHESLRHVNALRIDLTQPKPAPSGAMAEAARTGVLPVRTKKPEHDASYDFELDDAPPALPGKRAVAAEPLQLQIDESGRKPGSRGRRKNYNAAPVLPHKSGKTLYIAGGVVGGLLCVIVAVVMLQVMKPGKEKPKELVENAAVVETPVVSHPTGSVAVVSEPVASVLSVPLASSGEIDSAQVVSNEEGKSEAKAMSATPEKAGSADVEQQMKDGDFRNLEITKGMPEFKPREDRTLYSNTMWKQGASQEFDVEYMGDSPVGVKLANILFPPVNWKDGDPRKSNFLEFSEGIIRSVSKQKGDGVTEFYRLRLDGNKLAINGSRYVSDKIIPAILMQSVVVIEEEGVNAYLSLFPPLEYSVGGRLLSVRQVKDFDSSSSSFGTLSSNDSSWPLLAKSIDAESLKLKCSSLKQEFALTRLENQSELFFNVADTGKLLQGYNPDLTNRSVTESYHSIDRNKEWNLFQARTINPPKIFVKIKPTSVEIKFDESFSKDIEMALNEIANELRQNIYNDSFRSGDNQEYMKRVEAFNGVRKQFLDVLNENKVILEKIRDEVVNLNGAIQYSVFDPVKDKKITFDFIRFKEPK